MVSKFYFKDSSTDVCSSCFSVSKDSFTFPTILLNKFSSSLLKPRINMLAGRMFLLAILSSRLTIDWVIVFSGWSTSNVTITRVLSVRKCSHIPSVHSYKFKHLFDASYLAKANRWVCLTVVELLLFNKLITFGWVLSSLIITTLAVFASLKP